MIRYPSDTDGNYFFAFVAGSAAMNNGFLLSDNPFTNEKMKKGWNDGWNKEDEKKKS